MSRPINIARVNSKERLQSPSTAGGCHYRCQNFTLLLTKTHDLTNLATNRTKNEALARVMAQAPGRITGLCMYFAGIHLYCMLAWNVSFHPINNAETGEQCFINRPMLGPKELHHAFRYFYQGKHYNGCLNRMQTSHILQWSCINMKVKCKTQAWGLVRTEEQRIPSPSTNRNILQCTGFKMRLLQQPRPEYIFPINKTTVNT